MAVIKKLDKFILKSFLLLFCATFFICLFIFMMQFLWKYVDELVGKGLTFDLLAQFFYYSALTLVPSSMPLAKDRGPLSDKEFAKNRLQLSGKLATEIFNTANKVLQ